MVVHIMIFVFTAFCWSAWGTFSNRNVWILPAKISLSKSKCDRTFRRQPMWGISLEQGISLLICPFSVPYDISPIYPQLSFFSS